jgi:hypothetical protein
MPPSPLQPQVPTRQSNTVGLVALILSIIGFVFACIPGALIVGWVLLPAAFILSIVGLCLSGKSKGTSIAAVIISIIGVVVGFVVFFAVVGNAFHDAFSTSDFGKSELSAPSSATTIRSEESNQPGRRVRSGAARAVRNCASASPRPAAGPCSPDLTHNPRIRMPGPVGTHSPTQSAPPRTNTTNLITNTDPRS